MTKGFNIICRNGRYYFRARLPRHIALITGQKEIKRSLGTTSITEARKRAKPLVALISQLRFMSEIDNILKQLKDAGITSDKVIHKIGKISIGNVLIENLEVDPSVPGDAEAAAMAIRAAVESQSLQPTLHKLKSEEIPLREGIEAYIKENKLENWTTRTVNEYRGFFELLLRLIGEDITCDQVTHKTAREVKESLLKLPPNFDKIQKYKGKTIAQVIACNDKPRSITTVNKIIVRYSSLFAWLKRNGYTSENVFLELTVKFKKSSSNSRRPYTQEELVILFDHLFQSKLKHAYQKWIPLIGLFTGMRIEEICQLHSSDIKQDAETGYWYIDVNDEDDKTVKGPNSIRKVPIHSTLDRYGFFAYVHDMNAVKSKHLFPELKSISGRRSHAASRWFSNVRTKLGWFNSEPKLDFHSFRHLVATQLLHAGVEELTAATILGHAFGRSETGKTYTTRPGLNITKPAIEKLDFYLPFF